MCMGNSYTTITSYVKFFYLCRATIQDPDTRELSEIRWLFPIHGIPECKPVKDSQAAIFDCQARERIEQRLEVTLSGVAPNTSGSQKGMRIRSKTPLTEEPRHPDGVIVGEGAERTNCVYSIVNKNESDVLSMS